MSVVALTASRTSPGATTLAAGLAIAWSHSVDRSLLIEADPAGGVLALRFDLAPAPSLTSFGSDIRNQFHSDHVWANTQDLRGVRCIPAPVDPLLARTWIDRVAPTLIEELPQLGAPTVIDLGWVDHEGASTALASAADRTLIVTRPDVAEIQALLFQVRRLQATDTEVALVTIGDSPHDPQEVARLAGVPLAAILPDDPKVAAALAGGTFKPNKFRRSMLWRTISGLAATLLDEELLHSRAAMGKAPLPIIAEPLPLPPQPSAQSVAAVLATAETPGAIMAIASTPTSPSYPATPMNDPGLFEATIRMGSPVAELGASLILPTGERRRLASADAFTVGRHSHCDIVLNDSQVSRRHGRLVRSAGGWHYADLGSRNGTELNGQPCTDVALSTGDVLTIGRSAVTFETTSQREMECA